MKRTIITIAAAALSVAIQAQTAREEIDANIYLSGSNYLDYDRQLPTEKLTPTPKGYEPYYFSHYGRHGSRWLIGKHSYTYVIDILAKAKEQGKLTAKGEETLANVQKINETSIDRLGDLTTVGERQHHGIGKRMTQNFPEIFKHKDVFIDARSTTVNRCILSMVAECEEFMAANPTAHIHNDVSESLQYYLNQPWSDFLRKTRHKGDSVGSVYAKKYLNPERISTVLFNDAQWVNDSIDAGRLMYQLFDITTNMQSHDIDIDMFPLFTPDEIYDMWRMVNVNWYLRYGPSPYSDGLLPFSQYNLLRNIIASADTVTQTQAVLRFGHEVCVLPLASLLELGDCAAQIENLDELDTVWRNYRIFPMACNIQLIFYRPAKGKKGDILVKALLNEREVTMPVKTDMYPYYKWSDLRQYYVNKLDNFAAKSASN